MSFEVYYDNDAMQAIAVNQTVNAGTETVSTTLNQDKAIRKIKHVQRIGKGRHSLELWRT